MTFFAAGRCPHCSAAAAAGYRLSVAATYWRLRGQVLCSTCQDKQDSGQGEAGVHMLNVDHHPAQPKQ